MSEVLKLTNGELQRMRAALGILGNRRMANIGADLKVARLLKIVTAHTEPIEALKRAAALALVNEIPEGAELTPLQEQILGMRIAEAQAKVDSAALGVDGTSVEIAVPDGCLLKQDDLPKEQTGKDGWLNASQLGAVLADLGPLYPMDEG